MSSSLEAASLTADDLVTGEAVALDLPAASFGSRVVSGLLDLVATLVTLFFVTILMTSLSSGTDEALFWASLIATLMTVFLVIPTTLETLTRGKSLGKMAMGLRTVRDDAGPISAQHAFVRSLIGFVEIYTFFGAPAFFSSLLSERGKRLGDHAAGTYVIRERFPLRFPLPAPMPPHLADWARNADIAPLPTAVALGVRQFLARANQIGPAASAQLARTLADQVQPFVSPAPPPGTTPEYFLAAVLVSRRERDLARIHRENELRRRLVSRG
ncbi:RDD family protein [Marmoricola sp. OAE513]|uniref:RDD family protein n=1 Tax=Marmoricola sp. OAE513 TaxID=2817894 RepID=UPI001AE22ACB